MESKPVVMSHIANEQLTEEPRESCEVLFQWTLTKSDNDKKSDAWRIFVNQNQFFDSKRYLTFYCFWLEHSFKRFPRKVILVKLSPDYKWNCRVNNQNRAFRANYLVFSTCHLENLVMREKLDFSFSGTMQNHPLHVVKIHNFTSERWWKKF